MTYNKILVHDNTLRISETVLEHAISIAKMREILQIPLLKLYQYFYYSHFLSCTSSNELKFFEVSF
ncbi:MAG: hypothetical protein ACXWFB_10130 [Nitrososphaeraceae archaeon]